MFDNLTDTIAGTFLGKKVEGTNFYNPDFLVIIPRSDNREQYHIEEKNLPFAGYDVWHSYEFSTMTESSIPVTRVLKIVYPCDSKYIVESKSLKLYLNSFNMATYGKTVKDCLGICKKIIEKDLSSRLCTTVNVDFIDVSMPRCEIFSNSKNIMNYVEENELNIKNFKETPELLMFESLDSENEYFYCFDSLRSNCRVTHQPDFGDVFIYYKSCIHIYEDSLIKYLTSFRSEYHFHEECCEMIYKRLYDILGDNATLFVCALYTRRGGIDITPCRWNFSCPVEDVKNLINSKVFARYGIKQ